ncbi:MAG: glycosyltransferase family 87 protein [Bryobacteraceae bacterium]
MTGRFGRIEGLAALGLAFVFYIGLSAAMSTGSMYHDYLGRYTEGALVLEGKASQLYDLQAEREVQLRLGSKARYLIPCTRPAFYALLMSPLGLMSVPTGYWVWVLAQSIGAIAAWIWARRRLGWGAASAVALFLPLGQGILGGQDNGFVLALMLAAFVQLERGRHASAGALVAMTLFKSHLLLLLPVAMLLGQRWRMLGGYTAVAAIEVLISAVMASPRSYIELLTRKDLDRLSPGTFSMPNVYAILENLGADHVLLKLACAALIAVLALRPRNFEPGPRLVLGGSGRFHPRDAAHLLL